MYLLSEEISNKSLTFTFKAVDLSYDVLLVAIEKLVNLETKEKKGKQSIKDLRKKGTLQTIDITNNSYQNFKKYLKKFNIDYSILKNTAEKNQYILFFRNYDSELMSKIMENFMQDKFKEKESIKDKITRIKQKKSEISTEEKDKQISKGKDLTI